MHRAWFITGGVIKSHARWINFFYSCGSHCDSKCEPWAKSTSRYDVELLGLPKEVLYNFQGTIYTKIIEEN